MSDAPFLAAEPYDAANRALIENVHPADWTNPPVPDKPYALLAIGGGTAGLVTAAGAAGLGARVALIEKSMLGGDCLNVGCVPSKAVIASGHAAVAAKGSPALGVTGGEVSVDFGAAMGRMREVRAAISPVDSAAGLRDKGVDVFLGAARFVGPQAVEVTADDGSVVTLKFAKACVATGGRAALPPIEGLAEAQPLTNETVFSLTERPEHLVVLGGGPIGCELAQAFARLGTRVTLINRAPRILDKESPETSQLLEQRLRDDGVELWCDAETQRVARDADGLTLTVNGREPLRASHVLVSVGRTPNVKGLGLEAAGIAFDERTGVTVDDRLMTTNPNVFAAGDVASRYQFTHAADALARIVIRNALFPGSQKASALLIPWCTYVSPEVAHVGKYAAELTAAGTAFDTYRVGWDDVDRALTDGNTDGWTEVFTAEGGDKILGATVVGAHAGDLIAPFAMAMTHGLGLGSFSSVVLPYPTRAEVARKLGDQYNRTRLTPFKKKLMGKWLG